KQPTDTFEHAMRAGIGSHGFWNMAAGSGGPLNEQIGYRVDASYRRSDGWMERGDSNAIALSGALRFRPTSDLTMTLSHDFSRHDPRVWFVVPWVYDDLWMPFVNYNYYVSDADLRFRDNWS